MKREGERSRREERGEERRERGGKVVHIGLYLWVEKSQKKYYAIAKKK
jgi:hypothetical protein